MLHELVRVQKVPHLREQVVGEEDRERVVVTRQSRREGREEVDL